MDDGSPQPAKPARPVCFSLHKYFKKQEDRVVAVAAEDSPAPQEDSFVAIQAVPPPAPSWKKQQQADQQALQASADQALAAQQASPSELQVVPEPVERKQKGGRPRKAEGAPKSA